MKPSPYAVAVLLMMTVTLAAAQTPGGAPPSQGERGPAAADAAVSNPASNHPTALARELFKALDTNRDGFISREEAKGSTIEASFDALDKDRDGRLSQDEYAAGIAGPSSGGATSGTTSGRASMPK